MQWYHVILVIGLIIILAYLIKLFLDSKKVRILENSLEETEKKYKKKLNELESHYVKELKEKEVKHKKQLQELKNWYKKNEDWIDEKNKKEFEKCLEDPSYTGNKLDQYINSFTNQKSEE